jgi:hypothetical protein
LHETVNTVAFAFTSLTFVSSSLRSTPEAVAKSVLFKRTTSALWNITAYFFGFSTPSATQQITIQANLRKWLAKFAAQPLNGITEYQYRKIKNEFCPGHDILRHTFCSNHLWISGSFAETAMESRKQRKGPPVELRESDHEGGSREVLGNCSGITTAKTPCYGCLICFAGSPPPPVTLF